MDEFHNMREFLLPSTSVRIQGTKGEILDSVAFSSDIMTKIGNFYKGCVAQSSNLNYFHKVVEINGSFFEFTSNMGQEVLNVFVYIYHPKEEPTGKETKEEQEKYRDEDFMTGGYLAISTFTVGPADIRMEVKLNGEGIYSGIVPKQPLPVEKYYQNTYLFTFGKDALKLRSYREPDAKYNIRGDKNLNKVEVPLVNKKVLDEDKGHPRKPNMFGYPMFEKDAQNYGAAMIYQEGVDEFGGDYTIPKAPQVHAVTDIVFEKNYDSFHSSSLKMLGMNTLEITFTSLPTGMPHYLDTADIEFSWWYEFCARNHVRPVRQSWRKTSGREGVRYILTNDTPLIGGGSDSISDFIKYDRTVGEPEKGHPGSISYGSATSSWIVERDWAGFFHLWITLVPALGVLGAELYALQHFPTCVSTVVGGTVTETGWVKAINPLTGKDEGYYATSTRPANVGTSSYTSTCYGQVPWTVNNPTPPNVVWTADEQGPPPTWPPDHITETFTYTFDLSKEALPFLYWRQP